VLLSHSLEVVEVEDQVMCLLGIRRQHWMFFSAISTPPPKKATSLFHRTLVPIPRDVMAVGNWEWEDSEDVRGLTSFYFCSYPQLTSSGITQLNRVQPPVLKEL
jgi:hypothetical protein